MTSVPQKQCCRCGLTKSAADFNKDRKTSSGLSPQCRACRSAWRRQNAEKISEYNAEYQKSNREIIAEKARLDRQVRPEVYRERDRTQAERNRVRRAATARRRRAAQVQKHRDYDRARYRKNPLPWIRRAEKRRALLLERDCGCVTVDALRLLYSMPCTYCGGEAEHMEHVMPLARGGRHCLSNLVPSCGPCNWSKGTKILENPPVSTFFCTGVDTD